MSNDRRNRLASAHARASSEFRNLSREEKLQRMREAGVLGLTPHVGDLVRVLGPLNTWLYGVVIGENDSGRVHVAHNDRDGVVRIGPLEAFADGQAVQMVRRPPRGREAEVAARAAGADGAHLDLEQMFRATEVAARANTGMAVLGSVLVGLGLAAAAAIALRDDRTWDENLGRYRDARGRFA